MYNLFEGSILNDKTRRISRLFFGTKQFSGLTFREQTGYMPGYKTFCGYSPSQNFCITTLSNISDEHLLYEAVDEIVNFLFSFGILKPQLTTGIKKI